MADDSSGTATAAGWLAVGLATFTTALTAVAGLTGGVARMFRNHGHQAALPFLLIMVAVLFAVLASVWESTAPDEAQDHSPPDQASRGKPRGRLRRTWASVWRNRGRWLVALGGVAFAVGVTWAIELMVDTTSTSDRPALAAQIVKDSTGTWEIKGTARSSGLESDQKMQVYVYAVPKSPDACGPVTVQHSACGIRLFYVTTGPDQDGVASETFEIPLPAPDGLASYVITANLGEVPLNCDNVPIAVGNNAEAAHPPMAADASPDSERACMVFSPPPQPTSATTT